MVHMNTAVRTRNRSRRRNNEHSTNSTKWCQMKSMNSLFPLKWIALTWQGGGLGLKIKESTGNLIVQWKRLPYRYFLLSYGLTNAYPVPDRNNVVCLFFRWKKAQEQKQCNSWQPCWALAFLLIQQYDWTEHQAHRAGTILSVDRWVMWKVPVHVHL
jgi:hypothetical protein